MYKINLFLIQLTQLRPRNKNDGLKRKMLKMIDEQIKSLEKLSEELKKFNADRMETKKNVLARLGQISEETIKENVKVKRFFNRFMDKKIPEEEIGKKHKALLELIDKLEEDEDSEKAMEILAKVNVKLEGIYEGQQNEKLQLITFLEEEKGDF
jgi:hypothetical protein